LFRRYAAPYSQTSKPTAYAVGYHRSPRCGFGGLNPEMGRNEREDENKEEEDDQSIALASGGSWIMVWDKLTLQFAEYGRENEFF
jgi:hypothetical protein